MQTEWKHFIAKTKTCICGVMEMQLSDEKTSAVGSISLALSILIGVFLHFEVADFSVTYFIEGVLVGLSLVMNLTFLIRKRKVTHNTMPFTSKTYQ